MPSAAKTAPQSRDAATGNRSPARQDSTMSTLFDAQRHEPLQALARDEAAARAWIARYADDAQSAFTPAGLWPVHPRDGDDDAKEGEVPQPFTMVYLGAAGVIDTLDHLARAGMAAATINFELLLADLAARNLALVEPWGNGVHGLLMGQTGILLLHYRLATDAATKAAIADRIAAAISANADHHSLELLWGSPGTMLVAMTMHEWTGEERWADLFRTDARRLVRTLLPAADAPCRIWTQDLYDLRDARYIGAGHGFAWNASALIRGRHLLAGPDWGASREASPCAVDRRRGPRVVPLELHRRRRPPADTGCMGLTPVVRFRYASVQPRGFNAAPNWFR